MSGPDTRSGRHPSMQQDQQARAKWTSSLTKSLVDLLVDQIHLKDEQKISVGNKWRFICDEFYTRTGLKWDKEQLKYRCAVLRKLYATVKSLLDQSDFTWNETTGAITAKDEVWDSYIKEHPDADILRSSGCPIYKQLCIIFSESGKKPNNNGSAEKSGVGDYTSTFTEDCSTESEEAADVVNKQEKSICVEPITTVSRKRGRKGVEDMLADAILEMASASKMRAEAMQQYSQRYSVSKCVNALDELEGVDEKVYFAALDLFDDPVSRETFLSLKVDKRATWLQHKFSVLSSS